MTANFIVPNSSFNAHFKVFISNFRANNKKPLKK